MQTRICTAFYYNGDDEHGRPIFSPANPKELKTNNLRMCWKNSIGRKESFPNYITLIPFDVADHVIKNKLYRKSKEKEPDL